MKFKRLMLVTLVLLAILTIGAASAADDAVSDDVAASEEGDVIDVSQDDELIGEMDEPAVSIDVDESVSKADTSNNFTNVEVSKNDGNFVISTGEGEGYLELYRENLTENDRCTYDEIYEVYRLGVSLDDINSYIALHLGTEKNFYDYVEGNQTLSFIFEYQDAELLVQKYTVDFTDDNITFEEIYVDGEEDPEVLIEVKDVFKDELDKSFTFVTVPYRQGLFTIYVDNDEDEITLFEEDLEKTNRVYEVIGEGEDQFYKFSFTFNDLNSYIAQKVDGAKSFADLVDKGLIKTGTLICFAYDDENEIYEDIEKVISINPDAYVFDDAEEDVDVDYGDLDVIMYEGWKDELLLDVMVKKEINGTILIYLDDNVTPAFEKALSDLTPYEDADDNTFNHYNVTVGDLGIDEPGEYVLCVYLQDENGETIWQYDDEEPEILTLYKPKIAGNENATIEATPKITIISNGAPIITISAENNESDVVIYVDENETPITKQLKEFKQDEYGDYIITAVDLGLGVGEHDLNITYMGANLIATVDLISSVEIELAEPDEVIITSDDFDDYFVTIGLVEEDIYESDIDGKINVTIYDEDDNVLATFEKDIASLYYHDGPRAYVVRVSDMASNLNGTYIVVVRYFNGSEASTEKSGMVQFRLFNPADYGTSIKNTITDEEDYVITFTELPPADEVIVKIDGNETLIDEWDLFHHFDEEKGVYVIKADELNGLDEGTHSVVVGIKVNETFKELAKGNIFVDLKENYDLAMTISVANIIEGADAVIVITTNNTFTGIILVQIGTSNFTVSVTNGNGSQAVTGLTAGTYNATAIFKSNGIFNDSTKNTTFTVNPKVATAITASAVTTTYATSKNIVVTLKDANGNALANKTVTVVLNGATKTLTTNDKGQASLAIGTALAPKTYPVTLSFAGDSTYLASTGSVKVVVKKAKSVLTAKKKTFKVKKAKKYSIVLKSDKKKALKKVKVTLTGKFKGKKIKLTVKTNAKGKATFNLKKLTKKGKFTAKIKFAGNKYYNAVSKKVKITIK